MLGSARLCWELPDRGGKCPTVVGSARLCWEVRPWWEVPGRGGSARPVGNMTPKRRTPRQVPHPDTALVGARTPQWSEV